MSVIIAVIIFTQKESGGAVNNANSQGERLLFVQFSVKCPHSLQRSAGRLLSFAC